MQCALHPEVETLLTCGKCAKPICHQCLVHTPVGARCQKCANIRPSPIYQVDSSYYLKGIGAGLGLAILGGFAWAILRGIPFISIFVSIGLGIAIGEGVSRSVNRKRGRWLQVIAASSVVLSYFVGKVIRGTLIHDLSGEILWRWVFTSDVFMLLFLIAGVMYAIGRLR